MLRLLATVSWSDGEIALEEAEGLERLINASDLDASERATALTWLNKPVTLESPGIAGLSENQRLATYKAAVRMAYSDNELAPEERTTLDRIRDALGLSVAQAAEIESEMPKHD